MSTNPNVGNAFHDAVVTIVDRRIKAALDDFARNHRARGAATIGLTVGTPGVPLTTGNWVNGYKVPFPMVIDEVHLSADAVSDTQFDLLVQRHSLGQPVTAAASIVGGNYPELYDGGAVQEIVIRPSVAPVMTPPVWDTIYLEGGSLLFLTVLSTDGACSVVTFNLGGRAV